MAYKIHWSLGKVFIDAVGLSTGCRKHPITLIAGRMNSSGRGSISLIFTTGMIVSDPGELHWRRVTCVKGEKYGQT
jgi:hypothetical protein